MKTAGIICEYNPFHKGHAHHIEMTRRAGADCIICVMSGSAVQRGDVAVQDAHERARAATLGGADLVLELGPRQSLSPARDFAAAGVSVLKRLGVVDMISFGAENADIAALEGALERIEASELEIKKRMKGGSFPQAAAEVTGDGILSGPNNILAMEYLRAIRGSGIEPLAIPRTVPHDGETEADGYASASLIRKRMNEAGEGADIKNAERAILYALSGMSAEEFNEVPYCSELGARLYKYSRRAKSLEELCFSAKSRNFTLSRVRRAVLSAAIGIKSSDSLWPEFARVLALNSKGAAALKLSRERGGIAALGSLSRLAEISPEAKRQAELIERASALRSLCEKSPDGRTEYEKSAVRIFTEISR